MNEELLAGIRVLVALAKADGTVHDDERRAIENALDGHDLPVASLFDDAIELEAELARITSDAAKKRTYEAACAIVYVDGDFSEDERVMLAKVAEALGVTDHDPSRFAELKSVVPAPSVETIDDADKRSAVVEQEIKEAAERAGALAGTPLPIAGDSCLYANNVRLAQNIGVAYGAKADETFWRTFVSNILGAERSFFAVTSLLKLLPGVASNGPIAAYATTTALGGATRAYFAKGEDLDVPALQEAFRRAKKEATDAAKAARPSILARIEKLAGDKLPLDAKLKSGELDEATYAAQIAAL